MEQLFRNRFRNRFWNRFIWNRFWHRFLRELLGAPQLGAAPGGGTEFVICSARLVFALAQVRQVSAGILFVDVKGAFYSALAELAVGISLKHKFLLVNSSYRTINCFWQILLSLPARLKQLLTLK